MSVAIAPLGEAAFLLTLGDGPDPALAARAGRVARRLQAAGLAGVEDVVAAYGRVAIYFDPAVADPGALERELADAGASEAGAADEPAGAGALHEIPVRYDGPDLAFVAAETGLPVDEIVSRHAGQTYQVLAIGFVPGFAYLGPLDPALVLPRRAAPRTQVPAGSVAIAGAQTAVYPLATPGGWHLIGTTATVLFDPDRTPPAILRHGDRVRFVPLPS